jgi:hypothetical protein
MCDEMEREEPVVSFWTKDGMWHVALPDPNRPGRGPFWTDKAFYTEEEAQQYVDNGAVYT